jgi:ATP-dependent protease ClpP protease subunit
MQPSKITISGEIGSADGQVSSEWFKSQLPANGTDPIEVAIHSEGGSVIEGFAIYDAIKNYTGPKKCVIASAAFSIASFIPMAFDDVEITPNGYMMMHNPYAMCEGDAAEFVNMAGMLEGMKTNMVAAYSAKSGKTAVEVQAILDKETYLTASNALAHGFVNRITPTPVVGRAFAKVQSMPHGIVQALFGAGPGGDNCEPTREKSMSETQKPAAATVTEIKRKFPKAKAEFIVKCMEQSMPMEEVASAVVDETMAENETLAMKVQAMEDELKALKAQAAVASMPEEEEVAPVAKAKSGVAPVAKAKLAGGVSAKARWSDLIQAKVASGYAKSRAVIAVNKENPGLREQMLTEVNA